MLVKISYLLLLLVLHSFNTAEIIAMEKAPKIKEAEIIMPSSPSAGMMASFKETEIPEFSGIAGNVQLVSSDGEQRETIPASAAELSETFKDLVSEIGIDLPLPVQLTGNLFTKLVESLKALNTITITQPSEYSSLVVKTLDPLLSKMPFDRMLALLYESNRLNIKPLNWYITALFATELDQNKNLSVISTLTETLAGSHKDMSNLVAKMLEASLPQGNLSWQLPIPVFNVTRLAVRAVPHKGIIALTATPWNLYLWNLTETVKKEAQKELEVAADSTESLAINEDGTKALVLLSDGTLQLWNLDAVAMKKTLKSPIFKRAYAALSNDGKYALADSTGGTIDLWNIEEDSVIPLMKLSCVTLLAFSPDGNFALIGQSDNTILYVNIKMRETIKVLKGHIARLTAATFSKDGNYVITGSFDKKVILWDLTQEGKELQPFKILKEHISPVIAVAISPDNNYALTGSIWGTTDLWDVKSEKRLVSYKIAGNKAASVGFSSDGKYAVIASQAPVTSGLSRIGLAKEQLVVLWSLFKEHTLPEVVLFIKLNQLGKRKVIENPYFKKLYDTLLGY